MAAEELAADNMALSGEVVQLREDKASMQQTMQALEVGRALLQTAECANLAHWEGQQT